MPESTEQPVVETTKTGVRTVKAADIIQSKAGKEGLAKTKALFARVGGSTVAREVQATPK